MHVIVGSALVEVPGLEYSNAYVELDSDDDVVLRATVNNRQGVTLAIFAGPFSMLTDPTGWQIETGEGAVTVRPQGGCGCGGTSVTPRGPQP